MEGHCQKLNRLYRICSSQLGDYKYEVKQFMDELNKMYHINFKQDSPEVHPSHLCLKCYAQVGNFNRARCIPSTVPALWESHNESCCKSCGLAAK